MPTKNKESEVGGQHYASILCEIHGVILKTKLKRGIMPACRGGPAKPVSNLVKAKRVKVQTNVGSGGVFPTFIKQIFRFNIVHESCCRTTGRKAIKNLTCRSRRR
jgi:hypothetical protein